MVDKTLDYAKKNPHYGFILLLLLLFMWQSDKNSDRVHEMHSEMVKVVQANTKAFTKFTEALEDLKDK